MAAFIAIVKVCYSEGLKGLKSLKRQQGKEFLPSLRWRWHGMPDGSITCVSLALAHRASINSPSFERGSTALAGREFAGQLTAL